MTAGFSGGGSSGNGGRNNGGGGRNNIGNGNHDGPPENASCWYRGVRQMLSGRGWVAEIKEPTRGSRLFLGTFNTSHEAAMAYDSAARRLYGETAKLNLP
ncbi:OLC1v1013293C1 [Oldenlandia corymbosa var. corymbosa]|uniref:OLC1v1013293C1 n=1 Tax=Oldenlandia corymbosa var. corymbosa TaxID=529605 RepID=A0AAV1DY44_OLDCO|nr:OLC1v1013293C1 [Oldenlandia corymbosa var. corymbosa]